MKVKGELTTAEFTALLDRRARAQFGMSLDEFAARFEAGDPELVDNPGAWDIGIFLPRP
jgi:predicted NBD/HSP70 family sugar kinase